MWFLTLAVSSCLLLLTGPAEAGIKPLESHFAEPATAAPVDPRGPVSGGSLGMESIPDDFHNANTLTDELEYEDYLDFDKILAMGEDDYNEGDEIDDIPTPAPELDLEAGPSDPKVRRARLLRLFHGRSRLQRINVVNAKFGFRLYRSLRNHVNQTDNILFAPAGISIAMGMIALGVGPRTQVQLYETLGFGEFVNASAHYNNATVHKLFRKLTHRLFRRNFGYMLRSVNDLYLRQDVTVHEPFRTDAKGYYFAEPQSVDFADPAFLRKANSRIQKLTKGLIKEPLQSVDPNMVLMLLNYLYFKGTWEMKFPKEQTHYRNFRVNEKQQVRVAMMQNKGSYQAASDNQLQCDILRLPYTGNISMLVVIPQKLSGMRNLEQEISPMLINKWLSNMTNRTREVVFPRFNLKQNYDLIGHLKDMGLTELFEGGDFSPMTAEEIAINWFQHQGTITVNEEGTEAAALTQVGFMPLSTQTRFIVDRPFLFLIYEHRTDCLVFMGRVVNPTQN
ncbi:heparin cofactor 2 [Alosa pseudoharengus]|uniref:heparin cofactor 2 n=1 Tax=Alosa pseudoharengus TaxID=34774 RepID=UPI003F896F0A